MSEISNCCHYFLCKPCSCENVIHMTNNIIISNTLEIIVTKVNALRNITLTLTITVHVQDFVQCKDFGFFLFLTKITFKGATS